MNVLHFGEITGLTGVEGKVVVVAGRRFTNWRSEKGRIFSVWIAKTTFTRHKPGGVCGSETPTIFLSQQHKTNINRRQINTRVMVTRYTLVVAWVGSRPHTISLEEAGVNHSCILSHAVQHLRLPSETMLSVSIVQSQRKSCLKGELPFAIPESTHRMHPPCVLKSVTPPFSHGAQSEVYAIEMHNSSPKQKVPFFDSTVYLHSYALHTLSHWNDIGMDDWEVDGKVCAREADYKIRCAPTSRPFSFSFARANSSLAEC